MTETIAPDNDDQIQLQLARRNWIILGLLILGSLLWRSTAVTAGVAGGGLVAIIAFIWMRRSLRRVIAQAEHGNPRGRYQVSFLLRLAFIGTAIFVLIAVFKVNPVALAAGLSVMVFNILWLTLRRLA
ncbi:ATP synthase subunit I [Geoalkalibacter subterraneus]|jgi:hypothetical protein|uniref:ATP synthase subunit I n=1 Tax=Geoalkalibacter subterraneus TaxID=483547 RepID=A0A0B5FB44_9BACT|nr:ATP synthase subunit I [Geoalkalibacter subterraneus]AJF05382.1 hypothetical protein GSUB_00605 [Geoalkalibacter subterraneus]